MTDKIRPYKVIVKLDGFDPKTYECNFIRVNEYQHLVFHTTDGKKYCIRNWLSFIVEED